ncbi:transglycosylase SLT domain-containing protein [Kineococcus sp. SYSU DK003]|uniref:transglycosylase SLT domain-containing protein n=1 Tax=Kineococcus sp. SYSU DK003 TaxID=3383124 RepID=UPI003D7DA5F5
MSGIAEVQARISDIQARIAEFTGVTAGQTISQTATKLSATSSASSSSSTAFADALSTSSSGAVVTRGTRSVADTSTGQKLLAVAKQFTGTPYKWGGTTPDGFDCSGLIQYAGKQIGLTLPRTAAQQAKVGTEVPSLDQAKPGDLVVLSGGHHIGIYVGNGQMLHAPKTGDVVKISKVWETPMTIRRLGTTAATTAAGVGVAASLLAGVASADTSSYVRPASLTSSSAAGTSKSAPYEAAFSAAEQKYDLPTGLLRAVAKQESGFNPNAKSHAGATGLMQFMPATARSLGIDPTDPFASIDAAGKYLKQHLDSFGSVSLALAAYNAGAGNVRKYGGIPPFSETQNYVKKITADLGSAA